MPGFAGRSLVHTLLPFAGTFFKQPMRQWLTLLPSHTTQSSSSAPPSSPSSPQSRTPLSPCWYPAASVAAHLEPEIMLIDEVLAVGDIEIQKKCLGKMKDVTGEGRTVLFVSHNMSMIQTLCPESLLLANGFLQMRGPSSKVVETYLKDKTAGNGEYTWNYPDESLDNLGPFVPLSFRILDHQSKATDRLFSKYQVRDV